MRVEHIGDAVLYLGDCLEILPTLGKVDAVVTDPPYGVDFQGKNTKHTIRRAHGYVNGDSKMGPVAVAAALKIAKRGVVFPGSRLLFDYPRPYELGAVYCPSGAGMGRWGFTVVHPILFYGKGHPHTRRGPSGFTSFDVVGDDIDHPCPKPLRWMLWTVEKCSVESETILDPFMGSGTTGVACANLGRRFIGIEIEEKYFDIACRRIEDAYKQPRLFDEPALEPVQGELL